jgi:hypothetical protein
MHRSASGENMRTVQAMRSVKAIPTAAFPMLLPALVIVLQGKPEDQFALTAELDLTPPPPSIVGSSSGTLTASVPRRLDGSPGTA